ncbi:hypothetical protein VTI74DRAFT_180 [Chaetomium olivicolor]
MPDTYRSWVFEPEIWVGREIPQIVTLQQHDSSVPMPDPDFFRLHFEVAKILKMSGIGPKIIGAFWEQTASERNIAPDGSTDLGRLLSAKMLMHI